MLRLDHQPLIVEPRQRMFSHLHNAPAAQSAVIALPVDFYLLTPQALQMPATQLFAMALWLSRARQGHGRSRGGVIGGAVLGVRCTAIPGIDPWWQWQ
ncbi:hypothetical protein D3C84_657920 [compost metagenome]